MTVPAHWSLFGSRMVSARNNFSVYSSDACIVCEDAITVKNDKSGDQSWIIGGGAYKAADKVVQHNGCGTVNIIVSSDRSLPVVHRTVLALVVFKRFALLIKGPFRTSTRTITVSCTAHVATAPASVSVTSTLRA